MPGFFLQGIHLGNFKGVLFDKDGTISYSQSYLREIALLRVKESAKKLAKDLNQNEIIQLKDLLVTTYGVTHQGLDPNFALAIASRSDNLISTATVFCLFGITWPRAINLANEIFLTVDKQNLPHDIRMNKRTLIRGVRQFLDDLKIHEIKCALISNDTEEGIKYFLKLNNIENIFSAYWSCENHPTKPNPKAVIELCNKIKLHPSECVLIGDSDSDMEMAQKAGIGISIGYISGWDIKPKLTYQNKTILNWEDLSCQ